MRVNNNLSPLPFYDSPGWQRHNLPYANNSIFPFISNANKILPFQIARKNRANGIEFVKLYKVNSYGVELVGDILPELVNSGLHIFNFPERDFDIIFYPSTVILPSNFTEGFHYIEVSDGVESWHSEVFTFVVDTSGYTKITWRNLENLSTEDSVILMDNPEFVGYHYVYGFVAKPEYPFEEEGERRDGDFYPEKQLSDKLFRMTFLTTESGADCLRLLPLYDMVTIHSGTRVYETTAVQIEFPEWVTADATSAEIRFNLNNTKVRKIGGIFNNDFACCGGGNPGTCSLPATLTILGDGNPVVDVNKTYSLQKTGGSGIHVIEWIALGGEIIGSNSGSTVVVKWEDVGTQNLLVSVSCDEIEKKETSKPIVVKNSCVAPTLVTIQGGTTALGGSTKEFEAFTPDGSDFSYSWSVTGGTISGANNGQTVVIVWGSSPGTGTVSLSVTCGSIVRSDTRDVTISVGGLPASAVISGDLNPNANQRANYSLSVPTSLISGYHTVEWQVTGGTIYGANDGFSSVWVDWGNSGSSGTVKAIIRATGVSGTRESNTLNISVDGECTLPTSIDIIGPTNVLPGSTHEYSLNIVGGGSGYVIQWSIQVPGYEPGGEFIGDSDGETVTIKWGNFDDTRHPGSEWMGCYVICGEADFKLDSQTVYMITGNEGELSKVPEPATPTVNTNSWVGFPDFTPPIGVLNVAGDGFPLWANDEIDGNGKLTMFRKGWTNSFNLRAFAAAKWDGKKIYAWSVFYYMFNQAVRDCYNSGVTGVVGGVDYGDMNAVTADGDFWNTNIPYYHLTIAGAIEVGKRMNWGTSDALDQEGIWNISGDEAVLMVDEEALTNHSWVGGGLLDLMGYVNQGIMEISGNKKHIFWYGHPIAPGFNAMRFNRDSNGKYTDSSINSLFSAGGLSFGGAGFTGRRWYLDKLGAYLKVPGLFGVRLYKQDGGGGILKVGGVRQFRDTDFTVSHYGRTMPVLAEPDPWIKWNGKRADESDFYGWQSEFGTNNGQLVSLPSGWSWGNTARPNPGEWKPEAALFVEGCYMQANGCTTTQLFMNYKERSVWSAEYATMLYKSYQEMRCVTEPWTADGNSIEIREVGHDFIAFCTIFYAYSGGLAFSTWDDTVAHYPLPNKPSQLQGKDVYAGRYQSRLKSFQEAYKHLEGADPEDFKFANFYYPFKGENNSEVIAAGIYYGDKFHFCCLDPNRELGEGWTLQLCVGPDIFNLSPEGHEFYVGSFDVTTGLNAADMTIEYQNIHGTTIKVNGEITNNFTEHYE